MSAHGLLSEVASLLESASFASGQDAMGGLPVGLAVSMAGFLVLRLTSVTLPRGESVAADTFALMLAIATLPFAYALGVAVASTILVPGAAGLIVGDGHRRELLPSLLRTILTVSLVILVLRVSGLSFRDEYDAFVAGAVCVTVTVIVDAVIWLGPRLASPHPLRSLGSRASIVGGLGMVHVSIGTAVLSVAHTLGTLGAVLGVAVAAILQESVSLYYKTRRAYWQTVAALVRAAEMACPRSEQWHRELPDFAVEVGRELRLRKRQLEQLDFAARLREIGRLSEGSPDEPVAAVVHRSAQIVRGIAALEQVGEVIEASVSDVVENERARRLGAILAACSYYLSNLNTDTGSGWSIEPPGYCSDEIWGAVTRVGARLCASETVMQR